MKKILGIFALASAGVLAACGGSNPFIEPEAAAAADADADADAGGGGITGDDGLPPGTASPSATGAIFRSEDGAEAESFVYNSLTDTFTVDNLPFDTDITATNLYARVGGIHPTSGLPRIATLDPEVAAGSPEFAVYENVAGVNAYKMVYGVGTSTETRFTIIRSSSYSDYGFGGYVYERDGSVTIPTEGSGKYTGEYAGIRIFDAEGGLELVDGLASIDVDFTDLNAGLAVQGFITDRTAYNPETGEALATVLPTLVLNTGSITDAGEISGTSSSSDAGGDAFETGEYFAILSGTDASEMVGVVVVTSANPSAAGGNVQETGGFLANRTP